MKPIQHFYFIVLIALAGFICWNLLFKKPQPGEYWQNPNFKTDTLRVKIDYSTIPQPIFQYPVAPKLVINYIDSTRNTQHIHIASSDSLIRVIDSLKKEVTRIHPDFLKLYPKSHKLIYAEFKRDSLQLDLLDINGHLSTELYLVNYQGFEYQYKDNLFRANPLKPPRFTSSAYLYGGYDIAQTSVLLGADYSLYKGRYRLSGFSNVYINQNPRVYLGSTIGYKLK